METLALWAAGVLVFTGIMLALAVVVILATQGPTGLTRFRESEPSRREVERDKVVVARLIVRLAVIVVPVAAAAWALAVILG